MEHTPENCQTLAERIVDNMDMDTLLMFAQEELYNMMLNDKDLFDANVELEEFSGLEE